MEISIKEACEFVRENKKQELIFICIGTDRCLGDSYGPLVGSFLQKKRIIKNSNNVFVYGSLENPIHALNIEEKLKFIKSKHSNAIIIAIDASLGDEKNIGKVFIKKSSIKPGAALGKKLSPVGDLSLTGIVNVNNGFTTTMLINTRLLEVYKLAKQTEKTVVKIIKEFNSSNSPLKKAILL